MCAKGTNMILTDQWQRYTGDYEKEWHAIKTKDGKVYLSCWPNAGVFFCDQKTYNVEVKEENVVEVKKGVHPMDVE
jgi:uncharacterized C2H2 Zn-finger protein